MSGEASAYGEAAAADYDVLFGGGEQPDEAVRYLAHRRAEGRALELGVGTGRVAVPLAQASGHVDGLDASPSMLDVLRRRVGSAPVTAYEANMDDFALPYSYSLIYSMCSTFYLLRTQEAQVACLRSVARHLAPEGHLVLELSSPPYARMTQSDFVETFSVGTENAALFMSTHDPIEQLVDRQQIDMRADGIRLVPIRYRYVWPSELTVMAALAGLTFVERNAGWAGGPYTGRGNYVVVFRPMSGVAGE